MKIYFQISCLSPQILNDAEHERLKRRHEEERFAQERIRAQNATVVQP